VEKIRLQFLVLAVFGGVFVTAGADLRTNQLMIGDTVVNGTVTNGKIVGDRWMVVSNTLIQIHAEITPLQGPSGAPAINSSSKNDSGPSLRLMLGSGNGPSGRVKGLHGLIYMASDWRKPGLARTNLVDILSTDDKTRIVLMVSDNGPIYSSTSSGMNWTVINTPGKYQFPLTSGPEGGGFYAEATLHSSSQNQMSTNSPALNWYAIGTAPDGSKLVMTEDSSQPAPVLTITHSGNVVIVSWPSLFTGFVLQQNNDLTATNWIDVTNAVGVVGEQNQVIMPPTSSNNFYRLKSKSP
jgi:hypothetical protein